MRVVVGIEIDSEVDDLAVLKEDVHAVLGSDGWISDVNFEDIFVKTEHREGGCSAHAVATVSRDLSSEELKELGEEIEDCLLGPETTTDSFDDPVDGKVTVEFCH